MLGDRRPPTDAAHQADLTPASEAAQLAFFAAVQELALKAEAASGAIARDLDLAGTRVRLVFAGDCLMRHFMPALAHLEIAAAGPPDLTLHLWESETTGVTMLPPPFAVNRLTDRGDIWGWSSRRIRSAFHWVEFSLNLMDTAARSGVYWVQSAGKLPYWAKASPLRTLMHWWMEQNGGQLLHAACVGTEEGAVLVTGKGGVGKSTTALAALEAGLNYVGDDYLIVKLEPSPRAFSLYSTAKLNPDQVDRLPFYRDLVANHGYGNDEKAVLSLYPSLGRLLARSLPLRAVLSPRFGDGEATEFEPISKLTLQRSAAFTTMSQLPHAGARTHLYIERLIERVPGLQIALGRDIPRVPEAIRGLLARSDTEIAAVAARGRSDNSAALPLVSVIIPVYNGARFLPEAIGCVLSQDYPALEIIVVDDGSSDDLAAVIAGLPVDVRYFRQDNMGPAAARNRGIKDASGALIAFLDVDDLWPPGNLRLLADALARNPGWDVVRGHAQLLQWDQEKAIFEYRGNPAETFPNYIGAGLYRRDAFTKIGLFDASLRFAEDSDWYTRAAEAGLAVERLDQVTLLVRRHAANMTRGKAFHELGALRLMKKALDRKRAAAKPGEAAQ